MRVATDKAATIEQASSKPPEGGPYKLLPALHTVDYEGILCGVDDKGTTACRIGDHGFVLAPGETTLFSLRPRQFSTARLRGFPAAAGIMVP